MSVLEKGVFACAPLLRPQGEVLRWHVARGEVERVAAADYIDMLEREVAALRAQQQQQQLKVGLLGVLCGAWRYAQCCT